MTIKSAARLVSEFDGQGKKPRFLLIGNVANYAYALGKILRKNGIDTDVIDPDFYHIMASPEWYDVADVGEYGDDFFPKWAHVRRTGYRRPEWFIQGPWESAFEVLYTSIYGSKTDQMKARFRNSLARLTTTKDLPRPIYKFLVSDFQLMRIPRRALGKLTRWKQIGGSLKKRVSAKVLSKQSAGADGTELSMEVFEPDVPSEPSPVEIDRQFSIDEFSDLSSPSEPNEMLPPEVGFVVDREDYFRSIFSHYDVIIGFTTLSYFPAALSIPNFASIELGTVRGLPFEDSNLGKLTRWVYEVSPKVLVTNTDCMAPARKMNIDEADLHPILHPILLDELIEYSKTKTPKISKTQPYFFAPARHHWKDGNSSILKGNEIYIRAAAKLIEEGFKFRLCLVKWGQEVEESDKLISDLGLNEYVNWIKPLPRKALWPYYKNAIGVIDQFGCKAFGGVSLESMALGKRVITSFDWELASEFFETKPPIMIANSVDDVCTEMRNCLNDPQDTAKDGLKARRWVESHHSEADQLDRILGAISPLITP